MLSQILVLKVKGQGQMPPKSNQSWVHRNIYHIISDHNVFHLCGQTQRHTQTHTQTQLKTTPRFASMADVGIQRNNSNYRKHPENANLIEGWPCHRPTG